MSDCVLTKKEARAIGRARRTAIEAAARAGYDQAIYERLCGFIRDRGAFDLILTYASLPEEVDTLRLLGCPLVPSPAGNFAKPSLLCLPGTSLREEASVLRKNSASVLCDSVLAVPRVEGDEIHFYEITSVDDLAPGYRGILEPRQHCHKAEPGSAERVLIIVPGLAFTRDGRRVGYGGGYYDRFLAAHPALTKVALAYSAQILDDFETEASDIRMDHIITERELISNPPEAASL